MFDLIPIFKQHSSWLEVRKIIFTLNESGAKAYLAGGCVRDALLKKIPKDFDIATSAKPEEILKLFPGSNVQGKAFGVVSVSCKKGIVEIATFRKDGPYIDGRHPKFVEFLSDKEDALRRDFTINALFYNLETEKVIDYVDGIEDLQKKIIRTVGEPEKRFQEDHLRILRAIRFSVRLGFNLDSATEKKLLAMKSSLLKISRERVYEESLKILQSGDFIKSLSKFKELKLLDYFLGPFNQDIDWNFCLNFWKISYPEFLLKEKDFLWANAFYPLLIQKEKEILDSKGRWKKSFHQNLKDWKFPVYLIRKINTILYDSYCILNIRSISFGKKLRILNSEVSDKVLFLSRNYLKNKFLDTDIIDKIEEEFKIRAPDNQLPVPLITGKDLKALGIPEDENMARNLENLYDIQLERNITDKKELLNSLPSSY